MMPLLCLWKSGKGRLGSGWGKETGGRVELWDVETRTRDWGGEKPAHFDSEQVVRCIKARRLQHDLELDLHSVALVLDLLDQNRHMQRRLQHLEQLIQRLHN